VGGGGWTAAPYVAEGDSSGGDVDGAAGVGNSTRWARAETDSHMATMKIAIASHGFPTAQCLNT